MGQTRSAKIGLQDYGSNSDQIRADHQRNRSAVVGSRLLVSLTPVCVRPVVGSRSMLLKLATLWASAEVGSRAAHVGGAANDVGDDSCCSAAFRHHSNSRIG